MAADPREDDYLQEIIKHIHSEAVGAWREIMTTARRSEGKWTQMVASPWVNSYTKVKLYSKSEPCLNPEDAAITCPKR